MNAETNKDVFGELPQVSSKIAERRCKPEENLIETIWGSVYR